MVSANNSPSNINNSFLLTESGKPKQPNNVSSFKINNCLTIIELVRNNLAISLMNSVENNLKHPARNYFRPFPIILLFLRTQIELRKTRSNWRLFKQS